MKSIERLLPYERRLVNFALYDVIERQDGDCRRDKATGELTARLNVYGNASDFLFVVSDGAATRLKVALLRACPGLSEQGQQRAVTYLADSVEQALENELQINQY